MDPEVRFAPSGKRVRVPPGTSLLEAARRAGLPVASGCGAYGICGRCGMQVLTGAAALSEETESEERVKRLNRIDPAHRLACRVTLSGDVDVTTSYW